MKTNTQDLCVSYILIVKSCFYETRLECFAENDRRIMKDLILTCQIVFEFIYRLQLYCIFLTKFLSANSIFLLVLVRYHTHVVDNISIQIQKSQPFFFIAISTILKVLQPGVQL